ncbi:MAG: DMT family transporter [Thermodesulfobacteriota bacterium]|nr:DMT family transporter [Thermodesulfobacteriota bacterium]
MPYLLLTLTVLFWSGNFILGRGVHEVIPPIAMSFWRWTIALLIILPFAVKPLKRQWDLIRRHWKIMTLLAIFSVTIFNSFIYLALHSTLAVNAIIINAMTPIFIVLFSRIGFKDRITLLQTFGVIISFIGLLWIISHGNLNNLIPIQFVRGDLWTLSAAMSWAMYTILLRKRPQKMSPVCFLASIIIIGLFFLFPFYVWEIHTGATIRLTATSVISVLFVGVFPSVLAYLFWNKAVEIIGASKAGIFIHLMPVFGAILAYIFLGERLRLFHIAGICLIFFGIYLTTIYKTKIQAIRRTSPKHLPKDW